MGATRSKPVETNDIPLKDATVLSTDVDQPQTPTFSALRRLRSLGGGYEKMPENSSMNNLESPSGLKHRLIKVLGGYNLMDPRSPSQVITRTPINVNKKPPAPLITTESVFETSLDVSAQDEDPYRIFEEEQPGKEDSVSLKSLPIEPASPIVESEESKAPTEDATPEVQVQPNPHTILKSIYKDLVRRDPIYRDLLHEQEDETGKTTPVKKMQDRAPLSCVGNKNLLNSTPLRPNVKNEFADNFIDKVERIKPDSTHGDENTPLGQSIMVSKTLVQSKSKIPIRARRLE